MFFLIYKNKEVIIETAKVENVKNIFYNFAHLSRWSCQSGLMLFQIKECYVSVYKQFIEG